MTPRLDPAGPAALIAAATGNFPRWAFAEEPRLWNGQTAYDYVTTFAGHDVLRELAALAETGWRVQIKSARGRQIRISLYKVDQ